MKSRFITSGKEGRDIRRRLRILVVAAAVVFGVMLARLWTLQVFHGGTYRVQSERNRIQLREVKALRGKILDRSGRVLAENRAAFDLVAIREETADRDLAARTLSPILHVAAEEVMGKIAKTPEAPFRPVPIATDLSWEQVAKIEAHAPDLAGFRIQHVFVREYPYGPLAAHLLGHLGEITNREIGHTDFVYRYRPGDLVGKLGVERSQEKNLKGVDGGELIEVDAYGSHHRILERVESIPGARIYMSVDLDLQKAAEEALGDNAGAVVVLDPRNGEILSMVSHPAFDPNQFGRGVPADVWESLTLDPMKPLQNRAIAGTYSPGSTFKLITALAGLQGGRLNSRSSATCRGEYRFGDRAYRCWKEHGHGGILFHRALVESCDVFFYLAGINAGIDLLSDTALLLGYGRRTGIDIIGEQAGLIPTRAWKRKTYGEPWMDGETLSVAIGQSFVTVTPLQQAYAYGVFATGGHAYRPRIVSRAIDANEQMVDDFPSERIRTIEIPPTAHRTLMDALIGVVNEPTGTGWRAKLKGTVVAGKTGTAQVVRMKERMEEKEMDKVPYEFRDHAWFVALAPAEQPQVSVAVLVEHAGHGGTVAAPIARAILERYLELHHVPSL